MRKDWKNFNSSFLPAAFRLLLLLFFFYFLCGVFWLCGCPRLSPVGCSVPLWMETSHGSWWGCQEAPPQLPVPSMSCSHHGKMDRGWKLFVGFAIEAKHLFCWVCLFVCFFMKSHVFPVSLGTFPSPAAPVQAVKAHFSPQAALQRGEGGV